MATRWLSLLLFPALQWAHSSFPQSAQVLLRLSSGNGSVESADRMGGAKVWLRRCWWFVKVGIHASFLSTRR